MNLIIDQNRDTRDITLAISKIFSLNSNQILVITDEVNEVDNGDGMIEFFCEKEMAIGEFVNILSLFPQPKSLQKLIATVEDEINIAQQFCSVLKCRALIPSDSDNGCYILLQRNTEPSSVQVDFKNGINCII
jgi:hypothetical protein